MELKSEVLNILKAFDAYSRKNNIKYVLGYGTLLGAVRHKGFIPWDDDIDVILTTDEYAKLIKFAKDDKYLDTNFRYRIAVPGDKDYCYSFIKIIDEKYKIAEKNIADKFHIGLFIDVFRVDYWPESVFVETIQLKRAHLILKLNEICIRGNLQNVTLKKIDKLLKPVDYVYKVLGLRTEKFVKHLQAMGAYNKPSKYMGNIMSGSGRKSERLSASIFDEVMYLPFEDCEFPVPKQYDLYLKTIYGNYMKVPDKEHQISHGYDVVSVDDRFQ